MPDTTATASLKTSRNQRPSLLCFSAQLLRSLGFAPAARLCRQRILNVLARPLTTAFHILYYYSLSRTLENTYWLGTPVLKNTADLWIFQEIIYNTKPDLIIETGTASAGSALYMASICEMINHGQVVTIDIVDKSDRPQHKRIKYLVGSSTSPEIQAQVRSLIKPRDRVMVVLDSDHAKEHVLSELSVYGSLVTSGNYLIVEDTNLNGHPVLPTHGPGPAEAVEEFLRDKKDFVMDRRQEKFFLTFNAGGYLLKAG